MTFEDMGLSPEVLRAVTDAGYTTPTPIQAQAIPYILQGRDVLGCAQTGTGKTASFILPMIEILTSGRARARMPRSLILVPTRELATQVARNFEQYSKYHTLTLAILVGQESMEEQMRQLERGVDVLIATPGRMLDLYSNGRILLNDIKILVIDEADRMLDMGFIPDVERIVSLLPKLRQTLFFSATMAPEIKRFADAFLMNPREITVAPPASTAQTVTQGLALVEPRQKREALRHLLRTREVKNAFIFCNRKRDVAILYSSLRRHGFKAGELHGDMPQHRRNETLDAFKRGDIDLLVCSDVAARGLDIAAVSHVFNFDVPIHAEDYVHRIGRTGRAGRAGEAYMLATAEDQKYLEAIQKLIGQEIPRLDIPELNLKSELPVPSEDTPQTSSPRHSKGRRSSSTRYGRQERQQASQEPTNYAGTQAASEGSGFDGFIPAFLLRSVPRRPIAPSPPKEEEKPISQELPTSVQNSEPTLPSESLSTERSEKTEKPTSY